MLDAGVATAEEIDQGMVEGCAHPLGPLRLIDLIGIDTTVAIARRRAAYRVQASPYGHATSIATKPASPPTSSTPSSWVRS
ncbi:3-hydroxyacyl-CoA dehydrogenase family protein [Nocardia testacea]|uniref:3-hydroxyacyl-CoA dehydrogenase family protein n=1 Tax=Nocardia testacea TaxID=248551 RepID=A0ABW7VXP7_9NOCA